MGIDNFANRDRHIRATDVVQECLGIAAFDTNFAKGRHVVHADTCTNGTVFCGGVVKPVLAFPSIFVFARLAVVRIPICAFPTRQFTKHCAVFGQLCVEWRASYPPCRCFLPIGEMIRIEQPQRFADPFFQIPAVALERLRARNVDIAQIKRFFAGVHPM